MNDIKKQNKNFSVHELLNPDRVRDIKNQFQIDYTPMWHFLDNLERKVGGFKNVEMKTVLEAVYEFATIAVSLDKADMQARIDNLNEQNLKWFMKADQLEAQVTLLKAQLEKYENKGKPDEFTIPLIQDL